MESISSKEKDIKEMGDKNNSNYDRYGRWSRDRNQNHKDQRKEASDPKKYDVDDLLVIGSFVNKLHQSLAIGLYLADLTHSFVPTLLPSFQKLIELMTSS